MPEENYTTVDEVKLSLSLTGETFADTDIEAAIMAASREIDDTLHRRFWKDTDATQVRYYTPIMEDRVPIDDLVEVTAVAIDRDGSGAFAEAWTVNVDYVFDPLNAAADFQPYEWIVTRKASNLCLPIRERSVRVTGRFGWPECPPGIKVATEILTSRLIRRKREAPFGVVSVGVDGIAVRIARSDPDVWNLIERYDRSAVM